MAPSERPERAALEGYWCLVKAENVDGLLRDVGVPWAVRRASLRFGSECVQLIRRDKQNAYQSVTLCSKAAWSSQWAPDAPSRTCVHRDVVGETVRTRAHWAGDGQVVVAETEGSALASKARVTRCVVDGVLVERVELDLAGPDAGAASFSHNPREGAASFSHHPREHASLGEGVSSASLSLAQRPSLASRPPTAPSSPRSFSPRSRAGPGTGPGSPASFGGEGALFSSPVRGAAAGAQPAPRARRTVAYWYWERMTALERRLARGDPMQSPSARARLSAALERDQQRVLGATKKDGARLAAVVLDWKRWRTPADALLEGAAKRRSRERAAEARRAAEANRSASTLAHGETPRAGTEGWGGHGCGTNGSGAVGAIGASGVAHAAVPGPAAIGPARAAEPAAAARPLEGLASLPPIRARSGDRERFRAEGSATGPGLESLVGDAASARATSSLGAVSSVSSPQATSRTAEDAAAGSPGRAAEETAAGSAGRAAEETAVASTGKAAEGAAPSAPLAGESTSDASGEPPVGTLATGSPEEPLISSSKTRLSSQEPALPSSGKEGLLPPDIDPASILDPESITLAAATPSHRHVRQATLRSATAAEIAAADASALRLGLYDAEREREVELEEEEQERARLRASSTALDALAAADAAGAPSFPAQALLQHASLEGPPPGWDTAAAAAQRRAAELGEAQAGLGGEARPGSPASSASGAHVSALARIASHGSHLSLHGLFRLSPGKHANREARDGEEPLAEEERDLERDLKLERARERDLDREGGADALVEQSSGLSCGVGERGVSTLAPLPDDLAGGLRRPFGGVAAAGPLVGPSSAPPPPPSASASASVARLSGRAASAATPHPSGRAVPAACAPSPAPSLGRRSGSTVVQSAVHDYSVAGGPPFAPSPGDAAPDSREALEWRVRLFLEGRGIASVVPLAGGSLGGGAFAGGPGGAAASVAEPELLGLSPEQAEQTASTLRELESEIVLKRQSKPAGVTLFGLFTIARVSSTIPDYLRVWEMLVK